jgi:hypothetical protein
MPLYPAISGLYLLLLSLMPVGRLVARNVYKARRNTSSQNEAASSKSVVAPLADADLAIPPAEKAARINRHFDTRTARPLLPAVAAARFAQWMRDEGFTDYIWVGELDACYQWFCRENNYFPVEAKALRELLYREPGVYWGRPRLGGANWERFRRQMTEWYANRGLPPPERPVVIRVLPLDLVPPARVRDWTGEDYCAAGRGPVRVRSSATASKKTESNQAGRWRPAGGRYPICRWRSCSEGSPGVTIVCRELSE